jgi:programmed cell death protein 5
VRAVSSDEELEKIRNRRILELQKQNYGEATRTEQQRQIEEQKQKLLRGIMTTEARERLNRIKMVKPQFVENLELQLIQIAQNGRINIPITDQQLKTILVRLQPSKHKFKIRRI